ncbi:MAG: hypothetical protein PHN82_06450 [bacterium]|nr:hypothetical protein [bacterium]
MRAAPFAVLAVLLSAVTPTARADAARAYSSPLTITTYKTNNEGHLITFPDGTTLAIDCADGDIVTKSHFHADHCASCDKVGDYHRNNVIPGDILYSKDGVTVQVVAANAKVIGEERAFVNCPASDENRMSMALLVSYGGFDYLTAGDLTSPVENRLGRKLADMGVEVDVLKVSHHGSKSSSSLTFLQEILPEYAVVAGSASQPYQETLDNLRDAGVERIYYAYDYPLENDRVFRANSNVTITTDGYEYTFSGDGFEHGPFPVDEDAEPIPTPAPAPAQPNRIRVVTNPSIALAGDPFSVHVAVQPVLDRPFDAYVVIHGPAGVHSVRFGNSLAPGVIPIAQRIIFLPTVYSETLLQMAIPQVPPGQYHVVAALADMGRGVTGVGDTFEVDTTSFWVE